MKNKIKWGQVAAFGFLTVVIIYAALQIRWSPGAPTASAITDHQTAKPQLSSARVTMIDLGATECIPCKMMAPIIEELKSEYAGRADIIFIDVWKNPNEAQKYGIRSIPTQIFFDQNGRELYRHTGFLDKKSIVGILSKLGVS